MKALPSTYTIDSRDVAKMVDKNHAHLMRDIRSYINQMEIGGESNFGFTTFFIPATYVTDQNKELPRYDITKLGCEFIANKLTGRKGTQFTAAYVVKFNQMEMKAHDTEIYLEAARILATCLPENKLDVITLLKQVVPNMRYGPAGEEPKPQKPQQSIPQRRENRDLVTWFNQPKFEQIYQHNHMMSVHGIAKAVGVDHRTVRAWLNGDWNPTKKNAAKLADYLGLADAVMFR